MQAATKHLRPPRRVGTLTQTAPEGSPNMQFGHRFPYVLLLLALAVCTALAAVSWAEPAAPPTLDQVLAAEVAVADQGPKLGDGQRKRLARLLADPIVKNAQFSFKIQHLASGRVLFENTPEIACIPASTNKLVTGAAAFALLGPEFRFTTLVRADRRPDKNGVINGNLYLIGGGDPSLTMEQIWLVAHALEIAGVKKIAGDLVGDDSYHDQVRFYPEWGRKTARAYHAPLGGLSVNFNTVAFWARPGGAVGDPARITFDPHPTGLTVSGQVDTVDGMINKTFLTFGTKRAVINGQLGTAARPDPTYHSISEPLDFALGSFRQMFEDVGIKVAGKSRAGLAPKGAILLHKHESAELAQVVRHLFRFSNNFTAEQILRTIGAEIGGVPGTREKGAAAITDWLKKEKIFREGVVVFDGSGLARQNRQSAASMVSLLSWVASNPRIFPEYLNAQPIAGVNGTLRYRFKKSALRGRVRAKTGLLNGVISLAGYSYDARGEQYAFSALANNYKPTAGIRGPQGITERILAVAME
jgi:serine-type D-Ala-D-Ala carboxypeptidase/endopeptidase (penicillin-binding protein 4)